MRLLGLRAHVEFSGFWHRDRIGSAFGAYCLGLMGLLAALLMAREASAGALCPNFRTALFFMVGLTRASVAASMATLSPSPTAGEFHTFSFQFAR